MNTSVRQSKGQARAGLTYSHRSETLVRVQIQVTVYKKYKVQPRTVFPCRFLNLKPDSTVAAAPNGPFPGAPPAQCFHLRACADKNPLSRALAAIGAQPAHTPPSLSHPCLPPRCAKVTPHHHLHSLVGAPAHSRHC